MKEQIKSYLEAMIKKYEREVECFGRDSQYANEIFDEMIGAKELAEVLLQEPVNLGRDGIVRFGF